MALDTQTEHITKLLGIILQNNIMKKTGEVIGYVAKIISESEIYSAKIAENEREMGH